MTFGKIVINTVIAIAVFTTLSTAQAEELSSVVPTAEVTNSTETPQASAIDPMTWSLVRNAMSWLGTPYKRGGKTGDNGFDCSGFVGAVYKKTFGLVLPPSALTISKIGQPISFAELKIGDLIFFNTTRRPFSHVGIYMGEGRFIHASSTGSQIKVDNLDQYFMKRVNGYRRINPSGEE